MTDARPTVRRGRPPDLAGRRRTLELAGAILAEAGYAGLTMDLLALRSGVSKKSLYRWWPNKVTVVAEALGTRAEVLPVTETGDSRTDLLALARNARTYAELDELRFGIAPALSPADQIAFSRAFLEHVVGPRRARSREVIDTVVARGELPSDTDVDALLDLWNGFTVYRKGVRGAEVTDDLLGQLVDLALAGGVPRLR